MKPQVYYYLWQCPGWNLWRMLFAEQMLTMEESGLADACDFHFFLCGTDADRAELMQDSVLGLYKWIKPENIRQRDFLGEEAGNHTYEGWPLTQMREDSAILPDHTPMLYFHGKGSLTMNRCVNHWRKLMEHHCITKWNYPVAKIELVQAQAIGPLYSECPQRHFAGNFWWADSSYIATLPDPLSVGYYTNELGPNDRVKYEMWIGTNLTKPLDLYHTGENHYVYDCPPRAYINR